MPKATKPPGPPSRWRSATPHRPKRNGEVEAAARGPRRHRPGKLRADKAYYSADRLRWLRERGIVPRIARPGIETSERLGRHRWKIERSIS
ncbi:hypothetical protein [Streptomyces sp. YGL11-2]|uniref:hypothetical protein n=1 Tax=Streptomyces sp. YGL11-2 TaxID=3414028 RepID=UPI003CE874AB